MAKKQIKIASFGPYVYDDVDHDAISTEGKVSAAEVSSTGDLSGNLQGYNEGLKRSFLL